MAQFDPGLWTKKAFSLKRGTLLRRLTSVEGLQQTIAWTKRRGYRVEFKPCKGQYGLCLYKTRTIVVDPRLALETQLYVLLHECGHALIGDGLRLRKDWPRGYDAAENGYPTKGHRHTIAVIVEEIEAWNRGRRLASRLNLVLNDEAFNKIRDKLLKSHIESAL